MSCDQPRVWADVRLDLVRGNLAALRSHLPDDTAILGVVKADAYGHGAIAAARVLREAGVARFGVATVDEAFELRDAGFDEPIWHLGVAPPGAEASFVEAGLTPTIASADSLAALERAARHAAPFGIHLKLDTGMGRRGCDFDELRALWLRAREGGVLRVDGLATHLATADSDPEFAAEQLAAFGAARRRLEAEGLRASWYHACNSAGVLRFGAGGGNVVRPGFCLYGRLAGGLPGSEGLHDTMTLHATLVQIRTLPGGHDVGYSHGCRLARPTRVGLVSVGYGDGLPWQLSNGAEAIVGGVRVPYLGRVNMDLVQLDLNSVPGARVGDRVTLLGSVGGVSVSRWELAEWAGCSEYAVTTQLGRRVLRRYFDGDVLTAVRAADGRMRLRLEEACA